MEEEEHEKQNQNLEEATSNPPQFHLRIVKSTPKTKP